MTAASASQMTEMGDLCAARSKVDSMLGQPQDPDVPTTAQSMVSRYRPVFDRNAMIELRQARGRWSDESEHGAPATVDDAGWDGDEPIAFEVLDLPSFDSRESAVVRDGAAWLDRQLKISELARRAAHFRRELDEEAEAIASDQAIDLRDDSVAAIQQAELEGLEAAASSDLQGVVATIRKLSVLRDAGLLTTPEFDAKMADLLARV